MTVIQGSKSGIKNYGSAITDTQAMTGNGMGGVKVVLGKHPGGSRLATIDVSEGGRVSVSAFAEMQSHTQLLNALGEMIHAVVNMDPRSPQAAQAVQAIRNSAKAIAKGGQAGF